MPLYKLGHSRRIVHRDGIFQSYIKQAQAKELECIDVQKSRPFGAGTYEKQYYSFTHKGKLYAIKIIDSYNGHLSNYTDPSTIVSLTVAPANQVVTYFC